MQPMHHPQDAGLMPQDPSYKVHNDLLGHLHLTSTYQLPLMARLVENQALQYLLEAPRIFRELKPVAWMYHAHPQDGTVFFIWQSPRNQVEWASDGYVWLDPEGIFKQNMGGYVLEMRIHRAGFVYQREPVATHQRIRWRIAEKNPALPSTIDPNIWLVHYLPADPQNRAAVHGFPIQHNVKQLLQQRLYLEQQPHLLQRKEFMLMDRVNWPSITNNAGMHQRQMYPAYQQHPMAARQQHQQPYPHGQLQQPPPKRPRTEQHVATAIMKNDLSDALFEEDITEFGDFFDTLTPVEISKTRYKQHHEWMEEIYSSVYSLSQIVPEDLGFGLSGSLKALTEGILTKPDPNAVLHSDSFNDQGVNAGRPPPVELRPYTKLSAENMEEFERRIAQFVEKGQADIQAMKKQHAETIAQFNKSKTFMRAERKLQTNGTSADAVVAEVESTLSATIAEQKTKVCLDEGGLEKEEIPRTQNASTNQETSSNGTGANGNGSNNGLFENGDNSAAGLLDEFGGGSYSNSPAARIGTPGMSQPQSGAPTSAAIPGTTTAQQTQPQQESATENEVDAEDNGMDLLDGMDLDVDMSGLDGDAAVDGPTKSGAEDDWVMVGDQQQQQQSGSNPPSIQASSKTEPQAQPSSTGAPPASTLAEGPTSTDTPNLDFNSGDFGDTFDGLDTAGDALADFDTGGDLGLDLGGDSFNDAFGADDAGEQGNGS